MGDQHRTERQRTLIPPLLGRLRDAEERKPDTVRRDDLLTYRTVDLSFEAQMRDVHEQMVEYERSREPLQSSRWSKVCPDCGYVNHERYRRCEGCGTSLAERFATECLCPVCSASVERSARECVSCGSRFWSPILVHQREHEGEADPRPVGGRDGGDGN